MRIQLVESCPDTHNTYKLCRSRLPAVASPVASSRHLPFNKTRANINRGRNGYSHYCNSAVAIIISKNRHNELLDETRVDWIFVLL